MDKVQITAINAKSKLAQVQELFLQKLADYGVDDLKEPEQIIQRMEEKIGRIKRLRSQGLPVSVINEKISDTAQDLIGYSLILTLILNNEWGKENIKISDFTLMRERIQITRTPEAMGFDLPQPKKQGDVGYDLYTMKDTLIPNNAAFPVDVPTGCRVKLPVGVWGMIINRSSTPRKLGLEIVPGVIDNGYTGELFACVWNRTGKDVLVEKGVRLAQILIFNSITPQVIEVNNLPETERGSLGFGSTNYEQTKNN
jgi:dUTP pyrophosphatase